MKDPSSSFPDSLIRSLDHLMIMGRQIYTFRGFRWRGWFGVFLFIPVVALVLFSRPLVHVQPQVTLGVRLLAWIVFVAGAVFRFWAMLYLGGRKSKVAVTQGPYSVVRHPLYVGSFCIAASLALFLGSVVALGAVVIGAVAYAIFTVRAEERYLADTLGDPYRDYLRRTPRFVPRPSRFLTSPVTEVEWRGLRNEFRRAWGWMLIPWFADVVAYLRTQSWWPTFFTLP